MAYEFTIEKIEKSRISTLDPENIQFGKLYTDHMFSADFENGNWGNFNITPYQPVSLSPATSALQYGQSIFEGMKAFAFEDGSIQLFRPGQNAKRLNISAERMVMPAFPEDLFLQAVKTLVELDRQWVPDRPGSSLYIRPFMFATDDFIGVKPSEKYRFMIFCCPVGPYYNKSLRVKVEEKYSRAAPGGTGFTKCAGNYAASMYPTWLAQKEGFDQVLWMDPLTHTLVEETGTTNFFAVFKDSVVTPKLDESLLAGITRDTLLQIMRSMNQKVEERALPIAEIISEFNKGNVRELFICGTAATLMNVNGLSFRNTYYDVEAQGDNSLSQQLLQTLNDIRYGHSEDTFGWMEQVTEASQQPA